MNSKEAVGGGGVPGKYKFWLVYVLLTDCTGVVVLMPRILNMPKYTAKKFELCIPYKGISRLQSQFPHSCVCERSIYSYVWPTYFPAAE
jgi:hypothetical protein